MISKTRVGKIITSSLLCFSFGTMFTSLTVTSIGKFTTPRGKGGLETSTQPIFLDYSDFMAVADDFPMNQNISMMDDDYLPDIEIAEEDLIYQDLDDASFYTEREITIPGLAYNDSSLMPDQDNEIYVESDSEFINPELELNLDTELALINEATEPLDTLKSIDSIDSIDLIQDIALGDKGPEIPVKIAVDLTAYEEYLLNNSEIAVSQDILNPGIPGEHITTVTNATVDSTSEIASVTDSITETKESDTLLPVVTESTTELYADLKSNNSGAITVPVSPELTYQIYRVRVGDTIGAISQKYGLDNDTLFSVNEIKNTRSLSIGSYLKIPSMKGLLYTVRAKGVTSESLAKKFNVNAEKCARVNQKAALSDEYPVGSTIFIPDAKLDNDTRSEIEGVLWKRPLRGKYYVSSPYGWRSSPFNASKRTFHTGIDLAISSGTPIYAASSGTVIAVGYNAVYGNYVKIQHTSGYQTLYGHMSSQSVKKNQFVDTYTVIGRVGSTGQSTGPHLHFTLFRYGQTINPSSTGLYF